MNGLYFWFSLGFVALRTFFMMWTAASINDISDEIASSMYEIPTSNWCLDVRLPQLFFSFIYLTLSFSVSVYFPFIRTA